MAPEGVLPCLLKVQANHDSERRICDPLPTLEFDGASKVYTVWATGAGAAQLVEDMGL